MDGCMGRAWLGRLQHFPHIQHQEKHHCPVAMHDTMHNLLISSQPSKQKVPGPMPIQEDDATDYCSAPPNAPPRFVHSSILTFRHNSSITQKWTGVTLGPSPAPQPETLMHRQGYTEVVSKTCTQWGHS